jgi:hypothetical protein
MDISFEGGSGCYYFVIPLYKNKEKILGIRFHQRLTAPRMTILCNNRSPSRS